MKCEIINLVGSYDYDNIISFIYANKVFHITNYSCLANCYHMIADNLKINDDGIFRQSLYSQNRMKAKKLFLKSIGYNISSKIKENEVDSLISSLKENF